MTDADTLRNAVRWWAETDAAWDMLKGAASAVGAN